MDFTNRVISDDPEFMRSPDEKERAREELFAYFKELTDERRAEPRNDIVSKLVQAELDGEPLSWEDLAAYYFVLVGAGNETTRNLITGTVLAFHQFPEEWERLRADRTLLRPAIEEMLRFITPIRAMRRTAARDVEFRDRSSSRATRSCCGSSPPTATPPCHRSGPARDRPDAEQPHRVRLGHPCVHGLAPGRAEVAAFFEQVLDRGLTLRPLGEPDRLHTNQFHAFKRLRVAVDRETR
jgi:cytochrome P450